MVILMFLLNTLFSRFGICTNCWLLYLVSLVLLVAKWITKLRIEHTSLPNLRIDFFPHSYHRHRRINWGAFQFSIVVKRGCYDQVWVDYDSSNVDFTATKVQPGCKRIQKKCMLLTNVLLFLCFMDVYALEVLFPINETIIHRNMEFGPYYGNSCIWWLNRWVVAIVGSLVVSDPQVVCEDVDENYSEQIVLTMKSDNDIDCPFEYQVWLVGDCVFVQSSWKMRAPKQLSLWITSFEIIIWTHYLQTKPLPLLFSIDMTL